MQFHLTYEPIEADSQCRRSDPYASFFLPFQVQAIWGYLMLVVSNPLPKSDRMKW